MKYLAFEHLIYTTNLSEQDVIRILSENVGAKRKPFTSNNGLTKEYEGVITENNFEINRIIKNRNSFFLKLLEQFKKITMKHRLRLK